MCGCLAYHAFIDVQIPPTDNATAVLGNQPDITTATCRKQEVKMGHSLDPIGTQNTHYYCYTGFSGRKKMLPHLLQPNHNHCKKHHEPGLDMDRPQLQVAH
eukprot:365052-Chlamydomonas_euryale.AAC.30